MAFLPKMYIREFGARFYFYGFWVTDITGQDIRYLASLAIPYVMSRYLAKAEWIWIAGPLNYFAFQISTLYEKIGRWRELKQLQTYSSRFLLTLPRHQSTFPLAFFSSISLACCCVSILRALTVRWIKFVYIAIYGC